MKTIEVAVKKICTNKNYRMHSNCDVETKKLADSIKQHGLMCPLIVKPEKNGMYQLLDGNLRLAAWKSANIGDTIPCIERIHENNSTEILLADGTNVSFSGDEQNEDVKDMYTSIVSNLQRTKISPERFEEAVWYLHNDMKLGYAKIAKRLGYSKAGIQKAIQRMEAKQASSTSSAPPKKGYLREVKRVRTLLEKLRHNDTIDISKEVSDAMEIVSSFLDEEVKKSEMHPAPDLENTSTTTSGIASNTEQDE